MGVAVDAASYQILYAAVWYLLAVFLGVILLPITSTACSSLHDLGYSVSRILGILLLAYVSWVLSYFIGHSRFTIILSLLLICIFSVYMYARLKPGIDKARLLRYELIFASVFLFFLIIRAFNPEISGGEKFNDFMLFNSILRSDSFPPHDSWLSGFRMDMYYYFGTYTIATLTKLTGIPGNIAYNLGMALIPALAASAAFGLGYNLTKSKKAGLIAMFLLVFAGNLYPAVVISAHALNITKTPWGDVPDIIDYWMASRVIPGTINEFPYFSFIFGDLHAHVIAIPFVLLAVMLILNFYFTKRISMTAFILLSLSIGSLFVFNSWDYPTYAALFAAALVTSSMHYSGSRKGIKNAEALRRFAVGISIMLLGLLMFIAFLIDFEPAGVQGIKPVTIRTELVNFLVIYNLFLFLIFSFLLVNLPEFRYKKGVLAVLAVTGIALYFFPNFQTLAVFVPLAVLLGVNIPHFYKNKDTSRLFVSALTAAGFGVLLFSELFYFDDLFSGREERMNTVFKYYIQIWLLWSIASAYALLDLYEKKYRMKKVALLIFSILLVLNSLYLFTGTYAKTDGFSQNMTLDGMAFMKRTNFGSYDAINWVDININGTPVILEAPGISYEKTSLISSFTGLPTVIGWTSHELVWRNNWGELSKRMADVDTIYDSADYQEAASLLKKYNVSYVYVGDFELQRYKQAGLRKFGNSSNFEHVYRGASNIYKVNR